MTTLGESMQMRSKNVKQAQSVAPEAGGEMGATSSGSPLKASIARKNSGVVPSPGVEKTNAAS